MPIRDYELFIFDWDGTLSTSSFIVRVSNLLRREYTRSHIDKHREEYMKRAAKNIRITEEENKVYSLLYELYSAFFAPRLKEGAIEILKTLRKRKKKIAIFSDSRTYRLLSEAKKLGVMKYADLVLSASSIGCYKPDPTGLLLIADKFKINRKKTIYIGDMPSDIVTAKFAGIPSCGLADGLASQSMLRDAKPEYFFRTIRGLLKEIGS